MKTLFLLAVALVLAASGSFGQNGNITVSGTAYVNELNVSGVLDVLGNTQYLGTTSGSSQGVTFTYSDSAPATYSTILTQPDSAWSWLRAGGNGGTLPAMALDPSNRLILTGTQSPTPGSIVMDPNSNQITVNGQPVLTNGGGLTRTGAGNIGIGLSDPQCALDVNGNAAFVQDGVASGQNFGRAIQMFAASDPGTGDQISIADDSSGSWTLSLVSRHDLCAVQAGNFTEGYFVPLWVRGNPTIINYWGDGTSTGDIQLFGNVLFIADYWQTIAAVNTDGSAWFASDAAQIDSQGNLAATSFSNNNQSAVIDNNGNAWFSGTVEIPEQGDLSMGSFKASPDGFGNNRSGPALVARASQGAANKIRPGAATTTGTSY